jgi:hypothetical protein
MIGRRTFLAAVAATAARHAVAALPVPPNDNLTFRLIRHGSEIGRHTVSFQPQADTLTVRVAVDAVVTLLGIPIVRYTHRAVEVWRGDSLVSLSGQTNKNGQEEWMNAHRTAEGLEVFGSKTASYLAPETAIGTSYWNKRMLSGPMISLEDGVLLHPKIAALPSEPVRLASGAAIPADHYNLSGSFHVDLWYDRSNTWAGLEYNAADGSAVHYERL